MRQILLMCALPLIPLTMCVIALAILITFVVPFVHVYFELKLIMLACKAYDKVVNLY